MEKRMCAFMDRECTSDCMAWIGKGDDVTFECERLDSLYDIAWALTAIRKDGIVISSAIVDAAVEVRD